MQTVHEIITGKFKGSAFALAFETEQIMGFRSGLRGHVLRALHIDLARHTVEYELTQGGLLINRQVEYFPTLAHLIEKLPATVDAFDLKFRSLKLKGDGVVHSQPKQSTPLARYEDPWDLTNYCGQEHDEKLQGKTGLRLADDKSR